MTKSPRWIVLLSLLLIGFTSCQMFRSGRNQGDLEYWEERARRHGGRAVYDLGHSEAELDSVTRYQMDVLFPVLRRHLKGDEKLVLDFGSGTGRFTPALAELIDGRALGVDPIQRFLDLAPRTERVEYRLLENGRIPLPDQSADVVWISLVLTAIPEDSTLRRSVAEIERVLRPGGLLFLVENTHDRPNLPHLAYRPVEFYASLFPSVPLQHEGGYYDRGERISILVGRKRAGATPSAAF
ncbi:MAG: class I SAM-dependent methyltransferase [Gemmatimonadetes bacterium]|nr:class I SAM-dependent methyltransferase [Gemmatimonadota bacterium]